jgi:pimeloyl-ACP methyl ester carboxylesterase
MYVFHVRLDGVVEDVTFQSDAGISISGWFIRAAGQGTRPAIVLLHGSGPLTKDHPVVRIFANAFLHHGISVLTYDKRGVGDSGGTFYHNDYQAFIDDGSNAVKYLLSRGDVDPNAIGLLGSSEGGWFAPEIAVKTGAIAFIITRAGPAVPWINTNLWEKKHRLLDHGLPKDTVDEALELRDQRLKFIRELNLNPALAGSEQWHNLVEETKSFMARHGQTEEWLAQNSVRFDDLADAAKFWNTWQRALAYDPQPFIEQLLVPMLCIFAENDKNVPTAASVKYLESLRATSHDNIDLRVIAGVEHSMLSPAALVYGSHPDFIKVIGPWAAAKLDRSADTQK